MAMSWVAEAMVSTRTSATSTHAARAGSAAGRNATTSATTSMAPVTQARRSP